MTIQLNIYRSLLLACCFSVSIFTYGGNPENANSKKCETESKIEQIETLVAVRGFVVDEFGEPMVAVEVEAVGSDKKVITNTEGKYSILALQNDVLKFSQLGAITKEEKITSSHILNISLLAEK